MPTYQSYTINRNSGTSTTGNAPTGTSDGDLLVAIVVTFAASETHTVPTGWILENDSNGAVSIMSRIAASSDTSWEFGGSGGSKIRDLLIVRFTDAVVDQVVYGGGSTDEGGDLTLPSITTTKNDSVILYMAATTGTRSFDLWRQGTTIYLYNQRLPSASYLDAPTIGTYSGNQVNLHNDSTSARMYSIALSELPETYNETASGGINTGGEATENTFTPEVFGVKASGASFYFVGSPSSCPCHTIEIEASGGIVAGGSSTASSNEVRGGVVVNGKAFVDTNHPWSGLHGVWPIGGEYDGTEDEVLDLSPNEFHGYCGFGNGDNVPEPSEDGIYCSSSSEFTSLEWVTLPEDRISVTQDFSVSCWCKLDREHLHSPRVLFSRGFTTGDGDEYIFTLGYSWIHHVWAQIQLVGDETVYYEAFSSSTMTDDRWNHCAASWVPGDALRVWLNGSDEGSIETPEIATVARTNGNQIGRWNDGAIPVGLLQEVRLYPEAKPQNYWLAEYDNACKPGFYLVGQPQSATVV
ncbi:hypothetical protein C5Y96_09890 [Blastopirellula marina]|uniref:LamG-like jellyroll fold domain-containing protein n=1 Tax=Blastopirellula marina TaxID=124 RepID=A0A2S8FLX2_9BACT|nr:MULTISPECIES: LamG-like jellyroll fold domain-containing protein [Pirellulaceae]PQO33161.1 hypothetical protein C5Y96_09890 [Blastopirellula marina]RCS52250.1 LamG domain-containing protein [Bremerella cremea]